MFYLPFPSPTRGYKSTEGLETACLLRAHETPAYIIFATDGIPLSQTRGCYAIVHKRDILISTVEGNNLRYMRL